VLLKKYLADLPMEYIDDIDEDYEEYGREEEI